MQRAWKAADSFCEFWGSRLLRIKLVINRRMINVISVYAPTFNSEEHVKDRFYAELTRMLRTIPAAEEVFVLGDFNARVGRPAASDLHGQTDEGFLNENLIVGPYSLHHTNSNGERLLALCESAPVGKLRVMSTFFPHKHYGTWFHNKFRCWFQIDHMLAARRSARCVMDVCVKPGIVFNTDHRCVKVKLRFAPPSYRGRPSRPLCRPAETAKLPALAVHRLSDAPVADAVNSCLADFLEDDLLDEYGTWAHALRQAAEQFVGLRLAPAGPQWKLDHAADLASISRKRQAAFAAWKQGGSKAVFRAVCATCKWEVAAVLNTWWANKAGSIQAFVDAKEPQSQFAGFRELRSVLASGHRPIPKLRDSAGDWVHTKSGRLARWSAYFADLLNVPASVTPEFVAGLAVLPPDASLGAVPTFAETVAAVRRLKPRKACGPDGLPGDVLRRLSLPNLRVFHEHLVQVASEGSLSGSFNLETGLDRAVDKYWAKRPALEGGSVADVISHVLAAQVQVSERFLAYIMAGARDVADLGQHAEGLVPLSTMVEAISHGEPNDSDPWPIIVTFRNSEQAVGLREALLHERWRVLQGRDKELGWRPARHMASGPARAVLQGLGLEAKGGGKGKRRSPKREGSAAPRAEPEVLPSLTLYPEGAVPLGHAWLRVPYARYGRYPSTTDGDRRSRDGGDAPLSLASGDEILLFTGATERRASWASLVTVVRRW
ncbi:unnamed protein product [Durusdinium trenchii]|uniref:Endonuclease/exonuclease/phosphatase domain-containing protein n=1 Tax=Durusdinium trenchii TaxID=1381693 RepID=A0ABP0SD23_9DINO